jgi:archaemetzincin
MMWFRIPLYLSITALSVSGIAAGKDKPESDVSIQRIREAKKAVKPLHAKMKPPRPGDWLAMRDEPGQTFEEYLHCKPRKPTSQRGKIYIVPIGEFSAAQKKIISLAGDFMGMYYNLPVKRVKILPLSVIPEKARRTHPAWGDKQLLTTYILKDLLKPKLPADAAVFIAFTSSDLWPGKGWNFVFGQASLRDRVGVWSIYRNGDPAKSEDEFKICLLRTVKTAVHETGHMFSMLHCTAYECCMCGSNSRQESDRRPLALCPECMAKVCWVTKTDPEERYRKLEAFCRENSLKDEAEFYTKSIHILENKQETNGREK